MLLNIANQSLNTHSHKTATGEIITHSHPFDHNDNGPIKSHEHSSFEYLALSIFNYSILLFFLVTFLTFSLKSTFKNFFINIFYKQLFLHYKKNKSPPFLSSY